MSRRQEAPCARRSTALARLGQRGDGWAGGAGARGACGAPRQCCGPGAATGQCKHIPTQHSAACGAGHPQASSTATPRLRGEHRRTCARRRLPASAACRQHARAHRRSALLLHGPLRVIARGEARSTEHGWGWQLGVPLLGRAAAMSSGGDASTAGRLGTRTGHTRCPSCHMGPDGKALSARRLSATTGHHNSSAPNGAVSQRCGALPHQFHPPCAPRSPQPSLAPCS